MLTDFIPSNVVRWAHEDLRFLPITWRRWWRPIQVVDPTRGRGFSVIDPIGRRGFSCDHGRKLEGSCAMKLPVLLFVGGCAALQASAAWSQAPRFLSCEIPTPMGIAGTATAAHDGPRIFRLAPGSFSEWSPQDHEFGQNLCDAFACSADAKRVEGTISAASVSYSIGLDQTTGRGYWRATGASNLPRTEGSCSLISDPAQAHRR